MIVFTVSYYKIYLRNSMKLDFPIFYYIRVFAEKFYRVFLTGNFFDSFYTRTKNYARYM